MNYKQHYDNLIKTRRELNRGIIRKSGFELHHIFPKGHGGLDNDENLILLTPREHYIAHFLLWKINKNDLKMARAFAHMSMFSFKNSRILTSHEYEICRNAASYANSGENNPMYGVKHSKEMRDKISELTKKATEFENCPWCGYNCNKGNALRWHFDNCKLNPSYDASSRLGAKRDIATRNAIKIARNAPYIYCPKCNQKGRLNSKRMNRHLEKCGKI